MRSKVTKFRLSNHKLRIETGRRDQVPKQERFPEKVEDEYHFLFACPSYRHLRQKHMGPVVASVGEFGALPAGLKVQNIMSKTDFRVYKYIADGTDLRAFLTARHKGRD